MKRLTVDIDWECTALYEEKDGTGVFWELTPEMVEKALEEAYGITLRNLFQKSITSFKVTQNRKEHENHAASDTIRRPNFSKTP
jgi:hypothetical protein